MGNTSSHNDLARLLIEAGHRAVQQDAEAGEGLVRDEWPRSEATPTGRSISDFERLRVFNADGFRCRYTGDLLLLPAYLRALSVLWPEAFPYHPNWKSDETHEAYWTHTASLEALGWKVQPRNPLPDWDGGLKTFFDLLEAQPALLKGAHSAYFKRWQKLALEVTRLA